MLKWGLPPGERGQIWVKSAKVAPTPLICLGPPGVQTAIQIIYLKPLLVTLTGQHRRITADFTLELSLSLSTHTQSHTHAHSTPQLNTHAHARARARLKEKQMAHTIEHSRCALYRGWRLPRIIMSTN